MTALPALLQAGRRAGSEPERRRNAGGIYAGEGFDGVPHTHTLTQAEAVGRLEGYSA